MWRANLGINVALLRQEMKTVIAARNTGDFQILAGKWLGDYLDPVTFLELMTTNGGNNRTGWSNPAYDRLLAEAATLNEPAARFARLRQAEALMLAEAPIIPLYYQINTWATRKGLTYVARSDEYSLAQFVTPAP
jgi:oligopeptide transport system substrate-binding protein